MRPRIRHIKAVRLRNVGIDALDFACDLFVSLHLCLPINELLYVSEIAHGDADPDFAPFVLPSTAPLSARHIAVRVHVRPNHFTSWTCVLSVDLNLDLLVPIPTSTTTIFPPNTILLMLRDSVYIVPSENGALALPASEADHCRSPSSSSSSSAYHLSVPPTNFQLSKIAHRPSSVQAPPIKSYDYDTIRSITSATKSIQEITVSNYRLQNRIRSALASRPASPFPLYRIHQLDMALASQRERNHAISVKIEAVSLSFKSMDGEIKRIRSICASDTLESTEQSGLYSQLKVAVLPALANEIRCLIQAISRVFPIILRGSLSFSIVGIPFPESISGILSSCYARPPANDSVEKLNAAMGFIAQIVNALTRISNTQGHGYRIVLRGSRSCITQGPPAKNAALIPLYYDPANDEVVPRSSPSTPATVRNPGFERGLVLLNQTLLNLLDSITSQARGYLGMPPLDCIPPDCTDNILWTIHWIMLYVTALLPATNLPKSPTQA